jgi:hypothetical protein
MNSVFLVVLVLGFTYSHQFSDSISQTNFSSPILRGGPVLYESGSLGVSMSYPSNWTIDEVGNSTTFSPCPDCAFGPHVTLHTRNIKPSETVANYLDSFLHGVNKESYNNNFRIINYSSGVSIGGLPAYFVFFEYGQPYMDTSSTRRQLEKGTMFENRIYSINYDAMISDYQTYFPYVKDMIQSLRILNNSTQGIE